MLIEGRRVALWSLELKCQTLYYDLRWKLLLFQLGVKFVIMYRFIQSRYHSENWCVDTSFISTNLPVPVVYYVQYGIS